MNRTLLVFGLFLVSLAAHAQLSTQITILGVYHENEPAVLTGLAKTHLEEIQLVWSTSGISGTSIVLANGGTLVTLPTSPINTPLFEQASDMFGFLEASGEFEQLRQQYAADLIMVFYPGRPKVNSEDLCGVADMFGSEWVGSASLFFANPLTNLLDLRGSESNYLAIVTENGVDCTDDYNTPHEVGHLFGAGHDVSQDPAPNEDTYLYTDSHGYVEWTLDFVPPFIVTERTVMVSATTNKCLAAGEFNCHGHPRFSTGSPPWGDGMANALRTIKETDNSVANYYEHSTGGLGEAAQCGDGVDNDGDTFVDYMGGQGDPNCTGLLDDDESGPLTQCSDGIDNDGDTFVDHPSDPDCTGPADNDESGSGGGGCDSTVSVTNVTATLENLCIFYPFSEYTISWDHACPGAVSWYEIYYSQPVGNLYEWLMDVFSPSQSTLFYVAGADSNVRIIACGPAGCSNLSLSNATAVPRC